MGPSMEEFHLVHHARCSRFDHTKGLIADFSAHLKLSA